jgi:hypothetical protein
MKCSAFKLLALLVVCSGLCLSAFAQQPINNAQTAGTTTATGNGTTGAGSQRVTIASDNTAFAVNATLSAETTKVIGTINISTGQSVALATGSNWFGNVQIGDGTHSATLNSTTYSSKYGLDSNLLGTLGTAFSTAGKVDVKGADGDVFVRQTTGTNLHVVLDTTSTTAATQATASNLKVAMSGNAGAIMDFVGQNAAQPANSLLMGGEFNTTPTTITNGNASPLQLDNSGKLLVNCTGCSSSSTISLVPATTGGLSMAHLIAAGTNNATSLKGSAGQLYGASLYNNTSYPVYLKFCNKATACTCGTNTSTDTILYTVAAQAGTEREVHTEEGIAFSTGIGYCVVKGMGDTDNTSLVASDAIVDLIYK